MKLDRNINANGCGKYALIKLRSLTELRRVNRRRDARLLEIEAAIKTLERAGILDYGITGTEAEFFVMRLRDKYSGDGLKGYADAVAKDARKDPDEATSKSKWQWSIEVIRLARRAGMLSPFCKEPD